MYKGPFLLKIYILDVLKEDNGQRSLILDLLNEHLDQVILHLLDIRLAIAYSSKGKFGLFSDAVKLVLFGSLWCNINYRSPI